MFDSYAWVEYAIDSKMGQFVDYLLRESICYTPAIVIAELSDKFHREDRPTEWKLLFKFIKTRSTIIPFDEDLANQSGRMKVALRKNQKAGEQKIGLADAIIFQTALNLEAKLVTGDEHFQNSTNVIYLKNRENLERERERIQPKKKN